jgi:hypothetical protein
MNRPIFSNFRRMLSSFFIRRITKGLGCLGALLLCFPSAFGFSLIGPNNEAYQVPVIGYNPLGRDRLPIAPKNLGEEYRRNTPFVYYAFDLNFLDYFGSNGVYAVDQAAAILNGVTNVSQYSADLSEWPLESKRFNYEAQALTLYDVKSYTLHALVEQMGLTEPTRYVWTLHNRAAIPNSPPCPNGMEYLVIKRNFDPVDNGPTVNAASSYVNGTLYSYLIEEFCSGVPDPLAEAVEFAIDLHAPIYNAVADYAIEFGSFYTSLTRDDVGGLRYLLRTNNVNVEASGTGTLEFVTNPVPQVLFTSNLTLLASQALTNDAAQLLALWPNLVIVSTSNSFSVVKVTNFFAYFTNSPFDPVGGLPRLAFTTNISFAIQTNFHHIFGNVGVVRFTNSHYAIIPTPDITTLSNRAILTLQTLSITNGSPFASTPTVRSNFSSRSFATNQISGEFVIFPPNVCDVAIVAPLFTNVTFNTNILFLATNQVVFSNFIFLQAISQVLVDYFTNHAFSYLPVSCPSNTITARQGIEKITFIRRGDYDPLLQRFFVPITNNYTLNTLTNNAIEPHTVQRVITGPDILFSAVDLTGGPADYPPTVSAFARDVPFDFSGQAAYLGLAGPGVIGNGATNTVITFNKVGPIYLNFRLDPLRFIDEITAQPLVLWGSFDGTTNTPIVYPNGTSILDLENQLLMPIVPAILPEGTVGQPYTLQLTVNGGQAPFTFTLTPGSPDLPPGLSLSSDGIISGTPTQAGTYTFVLRVTDVTGRLVERVFPIVINP